MNSITTYFNASHSRKSDGKSPVYVYTSINRIKVQFHTGIYVLRKEWDNSNFKVKEFVDNAKDYNLIINNCRARITQIFVKYKLNFDTLTPELLRKEYKLSESASNFHTYAQAKLEDIKLTLKELTQIKHQSHLNKFKEFNPNLTIKECTPELIKKYIGWLRKEKDNKQTTIRKCTDTIKQYLNFAVKDKLLNENPFNEVNVPKGDSVREFLIEDELRELQKLYNSQVLSDTHQEVCRAFLLGCYTGLRISDIRTLRFCDIIKGEITKCMIKTETTSGRYVRIPLNQKARNLIYNTDKPVTNLQKLVFNLISEQKMRLVVKKLMVMIGVDRNIVFHSSRHTFATIFLRNTKDLRTLKELMGHGDIKQTMVYAHIISSDKEIGIKCFDEVI